MLPERSWKCIMNECDWIVGMEALAHIHTLSQALVVLEKHSCRLRFPDNDALFLLSLYLNTSNTHTHSHSLKCLPVCLSTHIDPQHTHKCFAISNKWSGFKWKWESERERERASRGRLGERGKPQSERESIWMRWERGRKWACLLLAGFLRSKSNFKLKKIISQTFKWGCFYSGSCGWYEKKKKTTDESPQFVFSMTQSRNRRSCSLGK